MFAPTLTYAYGTYKGEACLVAGYREGIAGDISPLVIMIDDGRLILAKLEDVKIDPTKLVRTTDRR